MASTSLPPIVMPARHAMFARARLRLSLRAKGIVALTALAAYVATIGLYVGHERAKLLHTVQQLERVHSEQELLVRMNVALAHSIVAMQGALNERDLSTQVVPIELDLASFSGAMATVR
ncbi:MAG TPA: hypothetical protein VF229_06865, partial [Burkholderiaceae bacterium]